MSELIGVPTNWRLVKTVAEAKQMVDYGVILHWQDARRLMRAFSKLEAEEIVKHTSERICENCDNRLALELLTETLLNWLANASDEHALSTFLETFLSQPNRSEASLRLVEVALKSELTEQEHDDELFAAAVSMVCELGHAIRQLNHEYPGEIEGAEEILAHVATYLLSVSNSNNNCIRLSLLNYFGASEAGIENKHGFNKIMGRFGHTILDHLYHLLFKKKTEAVALQYLLENMPYILEADHHAQKIIHETWKFYMLKKPERFGLFLKTFALHFKETPFHKSQASKRVFFQHLGALFRVVSEVNHRQLAQIILSCLGQFDGDPLRNELISTMLKLPDLRKNYRELLQEMQVAVDSTKVVESASRFVDSKRGRKPSFARVEGWVTLNQVNYLGNQPVTAKVS